MTRDISTQTSIQKQLKKLKRLGLTQKDIADLTGLSRQSIIRYKRGDKPVSEKLVSLALGHLIDLYKWISCTNWSFVPLFVVLQRFVLLSGVALGSCDFISPQYLQIPVENLIWWLPSGESSLKWWGGQIPSPLLFLSMRLRFQLSNLVFPSHSHRKHPG